MGSAHSIDEIIVKEKQGAKLIFLAPIFLTQKNNKFLNTVKFNLLSLKTNRNIIALGGIDLKNINQLKMTNSFGFAGISYFNNVSNVNK
jgi:thiamine monophosphate synthase